MLSWVVFGLVVWLAFRVGYRRGMRVAAESYVGVLADLLERDEGPVPDYVPEDWRA